MKNTLPCSCKKSEIKDTENPVVNTCGVKEPLKELSWLNEEIPKADLNSDDCVPYKVIQGIYQGKTAFIVSVGGPTCRVCGNVVYNCEGEKILVCNWEEEAKVTDQKVIWER